MATDSSKSMYLDTYVYFADFSATVSALHTDMEQESGVVVMSYLTSSASAVKLNDSFFQSYIVICLGMLQHLKMFSAYAM